MTNTLVTSLTLRGLHRHSSELGLSVALSNLLRFVKGNVKQELLDKNRFFETSRVSALECDSIPDILLLFDAIDTAIDSELGWQSKPETNRVDVDSSCPTNFLGG